MPYAERITRGKSAHAALKRFNDAKAKGDSAAMYNAENALKKDYQFFGYGYFNDVSEAIPNVPLVFYSFHVMVIIGAYLLVFFIAVIFIVYKRQQWMTLRVGNIMLFPWIALITIPLTYICHQCGWIVAEVGRQPWTIQDILPVNAAISSLSASQVITTFSIFALLFTVLLIAEVRIMLKVIKNNNEIADKA